MKMMQNILGTLDLSHEVVIWAHSVGGIKENIIHNLVGIPPSQTGPSHTKFVRENSHFKAPNL
jgi:hypothetical protein